MKRFPIIIVAFTLIVIGFGVYLFSIKTSSTAVSLPLPSSYEYYSRVDCPHCRNVDAFLASWEKKDMVKIDKFDTSLSSQNAGRLLTRAVSCRIPEEKIGVPLVFTPDGKCILGDTDVIAFFKSL